jgi:hypothetical protein
MKTPFILTFGLIGSLIADDQTIAPLLLDRNTPSSESGAKRANKDLVDQLHILSISASSKGRASSGSGPYLSDPIFR